MAKNPNQLPPESADLQPGTATPAKVRTASRGNEDESYKETFESVVIAFILAFVFRAYIVEAFVIPTGSMAPTLLGEHYNLDCVKCGYNYSIDNGKQPDAPNFEHLKVIPCPMCHFPNKIAANITDADGNYATDENGDTIYKAEPLARVKSGDRILVQKYVNSMLRRFDVVVFKAPHRPFTNYIKRLVGLEGEAIQIIEGNIYVNQTPDDETGWHIARKTNPEENPHALHIQNAVWQPIYHSQYVPLDWDKPDMRRDGSDGGKIRDGREEAQVFRVPWVVDNDGVENAWKTAGGEIELDPSAGYRHQSDGAGRIRFDFDRFWVGGSGYFPYGMTYGSTEGDMDRYSYDGTINIPVEDIRLAASFQPEKEGLQVTLRTTCRMDDEMGVMRILFATVDANGKVTLARKADLDASESIDLGSTNVRPFASGETRRVELWYVDQEASVWIDGERVLRKRFDLAIDTIRARALPCELTADGSLHVRGRGPNNLKTPDIAIEVSGAPVSIHRVELDRDLFYTTAPADTGYRATLLKERDERGVLQLRGSPKVLKKDEFFCMGDNSPDSHDSRGWQTTDYWVQKRMIAEGTPPDEIPGVVPARMLMGRAFFVYFPAPHGLNGKSWPFIPNFGDMRFIY